MLAEVGDMLGLEVFRYGLGHRPADLHRCEPSGRDSARTEDRPARDGVLGIELPAIRPETPVVRLEERVDLSPVRTHLRVESLGQEPQEDLVVTAPKLEPLVVEDPLVLPVVGVVDAVLEIVPERVVVPIVRRREALQIVQAAQKRLLVSVSPPCVGAEVELFHERSESDLGDAHLATIWPPHA